MARRTGLMAIMLRILRFLAKPPRKGAYMQGGYGIANKRRSRDQSLSYLKSQRRRKGRRRKKWWE